MTEATHGTSLTPFQIEIAQRFFATPAAADYVLAGGGGLAAQGLISRPTNDLDFFTRGLSRTVTASRDALTGIAAQQQWAVNFLSDEPTFSRMVITRNDGKDVVGVDLGIDVAPRSEPTMTFVGPVYASAEAAARKLVTLADRAVARDFGDVYALAKQGRLPRMIVDGPSIDAGFDVRDLAGAFDRLPAIVDALLPLPAAEIPALRRFFARWRELVVAGQTTVPELELEQAPPPTMM